MSTSVTCGPVPTADITGLSDKTKLSPWTNAHTKLIVDPVESGEAVNGVLDAPRYAPGDVGKYICIITGAH